MKGVRLRAIKSPAREPPPSGVRRKRCSYSWWLCYTERVKLIAKLKLVTTPEQAKSLRCTLEMANACCNWLSAMAWESKTFGQYALHKTSYHAARKQFPDLNSSAVVRCIAKVADAYKLDKKARRTFFKYGAVAFDHNTLRFIAGDRVSLWSLMGRLKLAFVCGDRQKELLKSQQGQSDLIYHRKQFYLGAPCEIQQPPPDVVDDFLGVDLGVANIASTSDGKQYSGAMVKSVRHRHRRLRTKLQKMHTRSAKRRLKKLSGKEARFSKDTNHVISKQIVAQAKCTHRGIAVEELTGIRGRIKAGRKQRAVLHSWAFAQLGVFLAYKAVLAGVLLVSVDPRNTSRTCAECGHIDKRNRPNQSTFLCLACGHAGNADLNAARVIAGRATINRPNVSGCAIVAHNSVTSRRLQACGS